MSDVNSVTLVGRLTREPELRSAGASNVCQLGLAVNERYKRNGEWDERANFFDVLVWGAQGENCDRFLEKGRQVVIDGRLRWESWEKDGQKRSKVVIVANRVQFLGGGAGREPATETPSAAPSAEPDDIPF